MDMRERKGLELAARARIVRDGACWSVPSETGSGRYRIDPAASSCTCEDFVLRGPLPCKHVYAVRFVIERDESGAEPVRPVEPERESTPLGKPTYRQDWPAYNRAQTREKHLFQVLLADLCSELEFPPQQGRGRPRVPLSDAVFSACFKMFSTVSGRRFTCDLQDAAEKGFIAKAPHFNSVLNCLASPDLTPILRRLITESSRPLKAVEVDFACDSSGFTTSRFIRWFDHKYGVLRQRHDWVKVHLMSGVKTNVVTAVEIRDRDASDTKLLPDLVNATAENFALNEVSADRGYGSLSNYEVIDKHGATPFIAFKSIHAGAGGGLWEKMFHHFSFNKEDYLRHYHKRSNVESVFSMMKAKFGDGVRSKGDTAMVNEVLCHNLCVLIQEWHELGIDPTFWGRVPCTNNDEPAQIIRFPGA